MTAPDLALRAHPAEASFPIEDVRSHFPALERAGSFVYFDNAAGAQAPRGVLDTVANHLLDCNVQRGGRYAKSLQVDEAIASARRKVALLLNADDPDEICFGLNATSFIRLVSLGVGQMLTPERNQIVVTDLDHDANVATWRALVPAGAELVWWRMREDRRLHLEDLAPLISGRTRLVACNAASHALGALMDVAAVAAMAHAAGAELFVDCVHYTPHAVIDVKAWGCDYLVCSGYKAFSPHMGFLWGRREALLALPTFREEFIPNAPPHKIEAGTFVYENVAGMAAAVDYLAALGAGFVSTGPASRGDIVRGMDMIRGYEQTLSHGVIEALNACDATIYGLGDTASVALRVPTVCFNLEGVAPAEVVIRMADADIGIRDGHMYAPRLMERLGLSLDSGAARVSLVHYNTADEIGRFAEVLRLIRNTH